MTIRAAARKPRPRSSPARPPATAAAAPTDDSRAATLRRRCRDRKGLVEFGLYAHLAKAEAFAAPLGAEPLHVRFGRKTRAVLESLPFEIDDLELLAGRLQPVRRGDVQARVAKADAVTAHLPRVGGQTGHCALDYARLFELGLDGLAADARCRAGQQDEADPDGARRLAFHRSAEMALTGLSRMVENAAAAVEQALAGEARPERQAELRTLAAACRAVAHRPPATFLEAIQLLWFALLGTSVADEAYLIVPGRLDRLLGGFYEQDLATGQLDRDRALELVEALYLLINEMIPDGLAMSVMVGGPDEAGHDTTNAVSYLALEALRRTRLCYPTVGVCWHPGTPRGLTRLAVELMAEGISTPAFFNDEVIQRGLRDLAVPPSDACAYINSTCVEITPVAGSNVWVASPYFNLCGILLETLEAARQATPPPADFTAFVNLYLQRLQAHIRGAVIEQNALREGRQRYWARPLQSALTRDCLARGLDIEAGGARYNWIECSFVGLANLADSLVVLSHEVFGPDAPLSPDRLTEVLRANFAGHEDVRQRFLNKYPKYGNAQAEVDGLVERVVRAARDEARRHRVHLDSHFVPGAFCWIMHEQLGRTTGATPDGRRQGFPFADGCGPAQGREQAGPTAAILSTTSWDPSPLIGGAAFNMKFPRSLFARSRAAVRRLEDLVVTFLRRGGFEVQVNVVDQQILLQARANPEAYRDLVVRIGGYTDYFTRLSPQMQEEVIARTAYESL